MRNKLILNCESLIEKFKFGHYTQYAISKKRKTSGLVLIELLAAVAIIGILIAIGVVSFQAAQLRARDSARKSDLAVITSALENYKQKYIDPATGEKPFKYPNSSAETCGGVAGWFCSNSATDPWIPQLTSTFIQKLPKDIRNTNGRACNPIANNGDTNNYDEGAAPTYGYYSPDGKEYILTAKLENSNDTALGKKIRFGNQEYQNHGCFAITSP